MAAPAPAYPFTKTAEALGALYVLEGSTLGGLLIAAHVRRRFGHQSAFHGSYGKDTAAMWRDFRDALDRRLDERSLDLATAAADRTFATLRRHLAA